jgi:hypothetical protein
MEQGDAKWIDHAGRKPSVTVFIDDHRRFLELQEPPTGRKRTRVLRTPPLQSCDLEWGED